MVLLIKIGNFVIRQAHISRPRAVHHSKGPGDSTSTLRCDFANFIENVKIRESFHTNSLVECSWRNSSSFCVLSFENATVRTQSFLPTPHLKEGAGGK